MCLKLQDFHPPMYIYIYNFWHGTVYYYGYYFISIIGLLTYKLRSVVSF